MFIALELFYGLKVLSRLSIQTLKPDSKPKTSPHLVENYGV